MKYFFLSLFSFLFFSSFSQNLVSWTNLKNINNNNGTLTKTTGVRGQATSLNMLYGSFSEQFNNGSLSFLTGNQTNEVKTIGFTVVENEEIGFETIEYGFSFQNNKFRAFGIDGSIEQNYSSQMNFKIERIDRQIIFSVNDIQIYSEQVDVTEYLLVRAHLKSNNASFSGVMTSFNTNRPDVNPIIFNSTKEIQLNNSLENQFSVRWEDGEKLLSSKKYVNAVYDYTLFDNNKRKLNRSISLGNDVDWINLNGLTLTNNTLEKTSSGNNWGTANSNTQFNFTENFWVETKINSQSDSKVLGFYNSNLNLQNTSNVLAGFQIAKDNTIQLIFQGSIIRTIESFQNDILTISVNNGDIEWKLNGLMLESRKATFTNLRIAALLKSSTSFEQIRFNKEIDFVVSEWDKNKFIGKINFNYSTVVDNNGPFKFIISDNYIESMNDQYKTYKDSNDFQDISNLIIDSINFYKGYVETLNYEISNLTMGNKHFSVFNSIGNRIHGGVITIEPDIKLTNVQSFSVEKNKKIKSLISDAYSESDIIFDETIENAKLEFKIRETKKKHYLGLIDALNPGQIKHGFIIENRRVKAIKNGEIDSGEGEIIRKNLILEVIKNSDKIILKIGNKEVGNIVLLGSGYVLKGGFATELIGVETVKKEVISRAKTYSINVNVINASCSDISNQLSFSIKTLSNNQNYTYNLINSFSRNSLSLNGVASSNEVITFNNIPSGVYELIGNIGTSNDPIYEIIKIGIKAEFETVKDYSLEPNSYSLKKKHSYGIFPFSGSFASAISSNTIKTNEKGWFTFSPIILSTNSENYLSINSNYSLSVPPTFPYIRFKKINNSLMEYQIFNSNSSSISFSSSNNAVFEIFINLNTIELYVDRQLKSTITRPREELHVTFFSKLFKDGFKDILFSFGCKDEEMYGVLKYKLDGYYHIMKDGKIMIEYDNEYEDTYLKFNIYNSMNQKIKTESSFAPILATFGKNYITIDVSDDTHCIGNGFFVIETINSKNEKKYIRFYTQSPNCPNTPIDSNPINSTEKK
jgi:hypothetical protein